MTGLVFTETQIAFLCGALTVFVLELVIAFLALSVIRMAGRGPLRNERAD